MIRGPIKYYSPITDVTFRKIFGQHIDLATSLLNAFLPLESGRTITSLHYISAELMPETPARKNSIVDVCCEDSSGSQFLVEMQLNWAEDFYQRVLFNTSKAYVNQLQKGGTYDLLQPVYSLNFVNGNSHPDIAEWYHPYRIVHEYHTDRVLEGLKIVFVEMEKFQKIQDKGTSKRELWMRFFTEMLEETRFPPSDLLADCDIAKAIGLLEAINYSDAERYIYDKYWDAISVEATWMKIGRREGVKQGIEEGMKKGMKKGMKEGRKKGIIEGIKEGIKEGMEKGKEEGRIEERSLLIRNMLVNGMKPAVVAKIVGVDEEKILAMEV